WWLSFEILAIRFEFELDPEFNATYSEYLWLALLVFLSVIIGFRLYQGLWRFFTFRDCVVTGVAFFTGTLVLALAIFLLNGNTYTGFPRSVLLINFMLILGWEIAGRGFVRLIREWRIERAFGSSPDQKRAILIGEPEECDGLIRSLNRQAGQLGKIVAIVTEESRHKGGKLHGIRIYTDLEAVGEVVASLGAETVVILPPYNGPNRVRKIVDSVSALQLSCEFRVVPSIDDITAGKVDVSQIRKVEIEDLLNRKSHDIDFERLREFISGKRILITGAGGSIGSEICRQVLKLAPKSMTLFEVSEFMLFEIERELQAEIGEAEIIAVTGDVKKTYDVRKAIERAGGIDIIFHAAAYKHVDLMERNPFSCFENNVIGTATLAQVAEEAGVEQFLLISSDKAVRPTSLMGASKRLAERVLIERPPCATKYQAVRFGNVLGSSGSVVPIFKKQISEGGPVTVSSKEVTRFFMTIPEAVELVLAASAIGEDRRVLVLEMGEPVKIDTLARKMIELSGFVPDVDIPIVYTGLKSGEKEYEELLTDDENVSRTEVDRIWVVARTGEGAQDRLDIGHLLELIDEQQEQAIREYAHSLIPGSRLMDGRSDSSSGKAAAS
ncbi:polysaccharide biosynthesis protein, partial [bacterium]|nr:polysaccharide biosynthesis protein [bacterium]